MAETLIYHVVPRRYGWAVRRGGASRASFTHMTKEYAVDWARVRKPDVLWVHRRDGTIERKEETYRA